MKALSIIPALWLTGCATLPAPGPGDAQVRLSQVVGVVEAGVGEGQGASCILTIIGRLPPGAATTMQQGTCVAQVVGVAEE